MRASVMAGLHFEFSLAASIAAISDPKQLKQSFNEKQTNMNFYQSLLKQLRVSEQFE